MVYDTKQNKVYKLSAVLFSCLLVTVMFIQLAKISKNTSMESLLFGVTFLLLLLCFVSWHMCYLKLSKVQCIALMLIAIIFLSVIISVKEIDNSYFNRMVIIYSTIICFVYVYKTIVTEKTIKMIYCIAIIQSIIFVIAYLMGFDYRYGYSNYLTFGFTNPNFTGLWLLNLVAINIVCVYELKKNRKWLKMVIVLALTLAMAVFIIMTGNRSSIMGMLVILVGIMVNVFCKKKNIMLPSAVIASLPIIVVVIYFVLVNSGNIGIFTKFASESKALSSRVSIWREGFNVIKTKPIFGSYYDVLNILSFSQLHNIYMDMATSYGIPVMVLFFIFLKQIFKTIYINVKTVEQCIAYWGITAIMVVSSFESALVSGSTGLYILICSLILLARGISCNEADYKCMR